LAAHGAGERVKEQDSIHPHQGSERDNKEFPKEDVTLELKLSEENGGWVIVMSDQKHLSTSFVSGMSRHF